MLKRIFILSLFLAMVLTAVLSPSTISADPNPLCSSCSGCTGSEKKTLHGF